MKKQLLAGVLIGVSVTGLGTLIYVLLLLPPGSLYNTFSKLIESGLFIKVATLGALPNVLVFHWLLKKNHIYKARGVVMSLIVLVFVFAVLKFR